MENSGNEISKEEKEKLLTQKMEAIKKKNEELKKRHQEIEADKKLADKHSASVQVSEVKPYVMKPPRPRPEKLFNLQEAESDADRENAGREVLLPRQRLNQSDGPPPDPSYRFLADPDRDSTPKAASVNNRQEKEQNKVGRRGGKHRGRGRGMEASANFDLDSGDEERQKFRGRGRAGYVGRNGARETELDVGSVGRGVGECVDNLVGRESGKDAGGILDETGRGRGSGWKERGRGRGNWWEDKGRGRGYWDDKSRCKESGNFYQVRGRGRGGRVKWGPRARGGARFEEFSYEAAIENEEAVNPQSRFPPREQQLNTHERGRRGGRRGRGGQRAYEQWKAERDAIDEARLSRAKSYDGEWRREWDMQKINQASEEQDQHVYNYRNPHNKVEIANLMDFIPDHDLSKLCKEPRTREQTREVAVAPNLYNHAPPKADSFDAGKGRPPPPHRSHEDWRQTHESSTGSSHAPHCPRDANYFESRQERYNQSKSSKNVFGPQSRDLTHPTASCVSTSSYTDEEVSFAESCINITCQSLNSSGAETEAEGNFEPKYENMIGETCVDSNIEKAKLSLDFLSLPQEEEALLDFCANEIDGQDLAKTETHVASQDSAFETEEERSLNVDSPSQNTTLNVDAISFSTEECLKEKLCTQEIHEYQNKDAYIRKHIQGENIGVGINENSKERDNKVYIFKDANECCTENVKNGNTEDYENKEIMVTKCHIQAQDVTEVKKYEINTEKMKNEKIELINKIILSVTKDSDNGVCNEVVNERGEGYFDPKDTAEQGAGGSETLKQAEVKEECQLNKQHVTMTDIGEHVHGEGNVIKDKDGCDEYMSSAYFENFERKQMEQTDKNDEFALNSEEGKPRESITKASEEYELSMEEIRKPCDKELKREEEITDGSNIEEEIYSAQSNTELIHTKDDLLCTEQTSQENSFFSVVQEPVTESIANEPEIIAPKMEFLGDELSTCINIQRNEELKVNTESLDVATAYTEEKTTNLVATASALPSPVKSTSEVKKLVKQSSTSKKTLSLSSKAKSAGGNMSATASLNMKSSAQKILKPPSFKLTFPTKVMPTTKPLFTAPTARSRLLATKASPARAAKSSEVKPQTKPSPAKSNRSSVKTSGIK